MVKVIGQAMLAYNVGIFLKEIQSASCICFIICRLFINFVSVKHIINVGSALGKYINIILFR